MRCVLALALVAISTAASAAATRSPPPTETITIDQGHTVIFCAGFCPVYVLKVRSDNMIEIAARQINWSDRRRSRVQRWRGRPGDFERFRSILAPIRPQGVRIRGEPCDDDICHEPRPYRYILSWNGPGRADRLVANPMPGDQEVACRVMRAVLDLGIRAGRTGLFQRDESGRNWPIYSYCEELLRSPTPAQQPSTAR